MERSPPRSRRRTRSSGLAPPSEAGHRHANATGPTGLTGRLVSRVAAGSGRVALTPPVARALQEHAGNGAVLELAGMTATAATATRSAAQTAVQRNDDGRSQDTWKTVETRIKALKALTGDLSGLATSQDASAFGHPAQDALTSVGQACTALDNRLKQLETRFSRQMTKRPGRAPNTKHTKEIREAGAALMPLFTQIVQGCMALARTARSTGDTELAGKFAAIADRAAPYRVAQDPGVTEPGPSHPKETAAGVAGGVDAGQSAVVGLGGGVIGAVEAGGTGVGPLVEASAGFAPGATAVGASIGIVGGSLGVVFGSLTTFLGLKAVHRGRVSVNELRRVRRDLTDHDLQQLTDRAIEQKTTKKKRGGWTAAAGTIAVGAGIVGLMALSIATLGVGAAVVGIAAAAIGLGFVAFKYFHRKAKRGKERDRLADGLVRAAGDDTDPQARAEARHRLGLLGFDLSKGVPDYVDVRDRLKDRGMNNRTLAASALWGYLVAGSPSQQLQSEEVLEALHLDPARLRRQSRAVAESEVARKLASW